MSWAAPAGLLLAAAAAPFELALPGSIAGLTLTTSELAVLGALALGALAWRANPSAFAWRTAITWPLVAIVACALLSSVAAPELRANALRVSARLAVAVLLFTVAANAARSPRVARLIAAALLASATIVGAIAVLELAQLPWVLDALQAFRPGFHVVGGQVRATSTLVYPTVTSMFLEVAFALGLAWIASSRLAFAALVVTGAGVIATFTRSGLITMALSLLIYGALLFVRRRGDGWTRTHTRLAALAAVLTALVLLSRSPQMLVARLSVEGSQDWYGAAYGVPRLLTLRPDSFNDIDVTVTNEGRLSWISDAVPPFALSYHVLDAATDEVVIFDGLRTGFAAPVEPGESVTLKARLRAPGYPGDYVVIWDVVQEHRTWLSLEGVFPGRTLLTVAGAPVGAPLPPRGRLPSSVMRMPRPVLWSTALAIWRERPWLGIGPDNFRHVYGRHLGMTSWDPRVHANSSYVEVLAGMGLAGAAALAWLALAALRGMARVLRDAADAHWPTTAAALAACGAIAVHALVDSFLTFTATYVVFAIAAGLLFPPAAASEASCA
jgi:hypothetical protein